MEPDKKEPDKKEPDKKEIYEREEIDPNGYYCNDDPYLEDEYELYGPDEEELEMLNRENESRHSK